MAKKGILGWLGFGREQEKPTQQTATDTAITEHDAESDTTVDESAASAVAEPESEINQETESDQAIETLVTTADDSSEQTEIAVSAEAEFSTTDQPDIVESEKVESETLESELVEPVEPELVELETAVLESTESELVESEPSAELEPSVKKASFFSRLKEGLKRTKQNFGSGFFSLFKGKQIDDDLFDELEEQLLIADVGVDTTLKVIKSLTEGASRKQLKDGEALYQLLQEELATIIEPVSQPLVIDSNNAPHVILMVGVNGVGKTTTIGKLAKKLQQEGKKVALAAGDTFRAAAVEQLQVWGERNDITVIAQHTGADSASVIFDAVQAAKARNIDVLIADTAGRLQNKAHLMDELKKILRVMKKLDVSAPHEVMLTLDAGTGQNAISQVQLFHEAVGVTGLTITKLDGTAKGGVIFALADKFGIPIRYIGVGEGIDDLREFNSKDFIEALFVKDE